MHELQPENFYGPVGERLRSWWTKIEKFGFDNELNNSEIDSNNEESTFSEEISFNSIQDPFVRGKCFMIDFLPKLKKIEKILKPWVLWSMFQTKSIGFWTP